MMVMRSCIKHRVLLFALLVSWIWAIAKLTREMTLEDPDDAYVSTSITSTTNNAMNTGSRYYAYHNPSIKIIGAEWSTLSDFYQESIMKRRMPLPGQKYRAPSTEILRDLEQIVGRMMNLKNQNAADDPASSSSSSSSSIRRQCSGINLLSLQKKYEIGIFEDTELDHVYCVLATTSPDFPWGTVVVHPPNADGGTTSTPRKNLSIDAPHPIHDRGTGEQAIAVFQGTNARSLLIAGAYRYSSNVTSCQGGSFRISDAAHSRQHGFHAAATAIYKYYHNHNHHHQERDYNNNNDSNNKDAPPMDFMAIQFHGMGPSTCEGVDAYLTHGFAAAGGGGGGSNNNLPSTLTDDNDARLLILSRKISASFSKIMHNGTTMILTPPTAASSSSPPSSSSDALVDEGSAALSCSMSGSTNLQGRLWNGVRPDQLCTQPASSVSGRFFHLEQKPWMRDPQYFSTWVEVMNEAYSELWNTTTASTVRPPASDRR